MSKPRTEAGRALYALYYDGPGDDPALVSYMIAVLEVDWLARALHESSPSIHKRRACRDRHDIRAADIAAEYARLAEADE